MQAVGREPWEAGWQALGPNTDRSVCSMRLLRLIRPAIVAVALLCAAWASPPAPGAPASVQGAESTEPPTAPPPTPHAVPSAAGLPGGSFDEGVWQPAGPAGVDAPIALAVDPQRAHQVYLAMVDGVYVSRDEGRTWTVTALPGLAAFSLHPTEPGKLFAVTAAGDGRLSLWRSEDRGTSWQPGAIIDPDAGHRRSRASRVELALDPSRSGRLYVAAVFAPVPGQAETAPVTRLWVSRDDGDSLQRLPLPTPTRPATPAPSLNLKLAVTGEGTLLVASGSDLHRRPSGQEGWQPAGDGLEVSQDPRPRGPGVEGPESMGPTVREIRHLASGGGDRRVLYATVAPGEGPAARVYRSIDEGGRWSPFGIGLPAGAVTDLTPSRRERSEVWAMVAGAGVFATRGDAWTEVAPALPPPAEAALLAVAPGRREILWAATAGGDLYRRAPSPPGCVNDVGSLCLAGRFRIDVDPLPVSPDGAPPVRARAVPLTKDGGWFWFTQPEHPEVVVRATSTPRSPGSPPAWTVYASSLSSRPFDLHVRDVESGLTESLSHRHDGESDGTLVARFPAGGPGADGEDLWFAALPEGGCSGDSIDLCLHQRRFEVAVDWLDADGAGGAAIGDRLSDAAGWFRFLHPGEPELVVKVLDGRRDHGSWQVAFASVSDLGFELTVTDNRSGEAVVYEVAPGGPASHLDPTAIPDPSPGPD